MASFKFNRLNYEVYIRFIELFYGWVYNRKLNFFMFTNKRNYIKCLEIFGIEILMSNNLYERGVDVRKPRYFTMNLVDKEDLEQYLKNHPNIVPYFRLIRLTVDMDFPLIYPLPLSLPYTNCYFSKTLTESDVDMLKGLYYHQSIKLINTSVIESYEEDVLKQKIPLINYLIEEMPVREYIIHGPIVKEDEMNNTCQLIRIPGYVEKITIYYYNKIIEDEKKGWTRMYKNQKWFTPADDKTRSLMLRRCLE